jgi:hypothetical protein
VEALISLSLIPDAPSGGHWGNPQRPSLEDEERSGPRSPARAIGRGRDRPGAIPIRWRGGFVCPLELSTIGVYREHLVRPRSVAMTRIRMTLENRASRVRGSRILWASLSHGIRWPGSVARHSGNAVLWPWNSEVPVRLLLGPPPPAARQPGLSWYGFAWGCSSPISVPGLGCEFLFPEMAQRNWTRSGMVPRDPDDGDAPEIS